LQGRVRHMEQQLRVSEQTRGHVKKGRGNTGDQDEGSEPRNKAKYVSQKFQIGLGVRPQ
jgi:hypothetical protein